MRNWINNIIHNIIHGIIYCITYCTNSVIHKPMWVRKKKTIFAQIFINKLQKSQTDGLTISTKIKKNNLKRWKFKMSLNLSRPRPVNFLFVITIDYKWELLCAQHEKNVCFTSSCDRKVKQLNQVPWEDKRKLVLTLQAWLKFAADHMDEEKPETLSELFGHNDQRNRGTL